MSTLKQAVEARGIDEKRVAANWRRRARHLHGDRPKVWATSCCPPEWIHGKKRTHKLFAALQGDNVKAYVAAWTVLNHLKEVSP